ncbi:MAG TPA: nuclear transport factor 2 family protein [Usitatibacter sp.]|nr:nuclear transport factor 2 family protein [Usitatibacter sp.]
MSHAAMTTEDVVRNHLRTFIEGNGVDAILEDYHDDARFHSEDRVYRGKREIGEFFGRFLEGLPPGALERFRLRSLRVDGELAYITWSVGAEIPLGTDTFVVRGGRIASQTFAMHLAPQHAPGSGGRDRGL